MLSRRSTEINHVFFANVGENVFLFGPLSGGGFAQAICLARYHKASHPE